jgi:putative CocE/NonD family hydrolase
MHRSSRYLTMPDGVRLAIDVYLPKRTTGRVATILHQTRYFRSVAMRRGFRWLPLARAMDTDYATRQRFLAAGYAWVSVCVRGSGASEGTSPFPWSEAEIGDGVRILDWIVMQPWSDGRVGSTGISYSGTSAELLASTGHPALRAIAPRFSCFDVYADVAYPGGLHLESFTKAWAQLNFLLDSGDIGGAVALNLSLSGRGCGDLDGRYGWLRAATHPAAQGLVRRAVSAVAHGVSAVDDDGRRRQVEAAIAVHAGNDDIHEGALRITYRDDRGISSRVPDASVDSFSPHARVAAVRGSGVAVLGYSGWLDGGYANAAAKRHVALGENARLILGPWNHGGQEDTSPFTPFGPARDDHAGALLAFFDEHVRDLAPDRPVAAVRYFTLGEERWKEARSWPPPEVFEVPWYLGPGGALTPEAPAAPGRAVYRVDPGVGTGHRSRWNSLLGIKAPIGYADAAELTVRGTSFTSNPLGRDVEVTGHPKVVLELTSTHADGSVFAYLVDVAPNGSSTIVTEGMLRLIHRREDDAPAPLVTSRTYLREHSRPVPIGEPIRVHVDLLPTSYRVRAGHRLRLVLTGADAHHFRSVTDSAPTVEWRWGGQNPPRLQLPVMAG